MIFRNTVTFQTANALSTLETLFAILPSLRITRFTVQVRTGVTSMSPVKTEIASFSESMATLALGEVKTYGWPIPPMNGRVPYKSLYLWTWNAHALEVTKTLFPHWLNTGESNPIHWSFFRHRNLVLDMPGNEAATISDLLPAEILELELLGLVCNVTDKRITPHSDPESDKRKRHELPYFGPHVQMSQVLQKRQRPPWWTAEHDKLILEQVKKDQWRWAPNFRLFTKELSPADIEDHKVFWEREVTAGRGYEVWSNGIRTYIRKRAIELGAPALVTTSPAMQYCAVCNSEFHETSARAKYFGKDQNDICTPCIDASIHGGQKEDFTKEETLQYLRELAAILGYVPESNFGSSAKGLLEGFDSSQRVKLIKLLGERPTLRLVNSQFGSWFQALKEAEILDDNALRSAMGTKCLATDGHICLSLAEKRIDDLLAALGIAHIREVPYAGGQFRADFMVGNTVIEYFGLMERDDYKAKAEKKASFCKQHEIPFLALFPEDVANERILTEKLKSLL